MASLIDRIIKSSTLKATILSESKLFTERSFTTTNVKTLNIAVSGDIDGGISSGITLLAGPSRHFKSNMGLQYVAAYLNAHKDSACIYFDSEFGTTPAYFKTAGIDTDRVIHTAVANLEELRIEIAKMLDVIQRGDKVIVFIDSVGNLASKKEIEDALKGKDKQDMTRAKVIKSIMRIITPQLIIKDIPCVIIAHTYQTQDMYPTNIISGGTGLLLAANTAIIVGRRKLKEGSGEDAVQIGYKFILDIEKSRFVKERLKVPLDVSYSGGIDKYSGMMDLAMEAGFVEKINRGSKGTGFQRLVTDKKTGEVKKDGEVVGDEQTNTATFWDPIFKDAGFADFIRKFYQYDNGPVTSIEDDLKVLAEEEDA